MRQHWPNSWVGSEHPAQCVRKPSRYNDVEFKTRFLPRRLNSTQTESQPAGKSSLNSRRMQSRARANFRVYQHDQPTTRVIQSGLSSASLSWSEAEAVRPKTTSHDDVQLQRRSSLPSDNRDQPIRLVTQRSFTEVGSSGAKSLRRELQTPARKLSKKLQMTSKSLM